MAKNLKAAIQQTVYFFSLFETAPRRGDVYALLPDAKATEKEFDLALKQLIQADKLDYKPPFVALPDQGETGVFRYVANKTSLDRLWRKVRRQVWWWQLIPFVRGVMVVNSLALGTAAKGSDIDVLVVTGRNRLFLARILLTAWVHLTGQRRHGDKIKERFCLSFWLDESALDLRPISLKDDPYLKYWLATVKPIYGEETYQEFMKQNQLWLKYFPNRPNNYRRPLIPETSVLKSWRGFWESLLEMTKLASWLNRIAKDRQLKRARAKNTVLGDPFGVVISETMLKFHDRDIRREIAAKMKTPQVGH